MNYIPDWKNKKLRCHFCGETINVKYETEIFDPVVDSKPIKVCVCDKCISHMEYIYKIEVDCFKSDGKYKSYLWGKRNDATNKWYIRGIFEGNTPQEAFNNAYSHKDYLESI